MSPHCSFRCAAHGLIKKGLLTEDQAIRAIRGFAFWHEDARKKFLLNRQASSTHISRRSGAVMPSRAIGGGLVGALVAGIALSGRRR